MKKLIDKKCWLIERSKSIISFGTTDGDGWDEWDTPNMVVATKKKIKHLFKKIVI